MSDSANGTYSRMSSSDYDTSSNKKLINNLQAGRSYYVKIQSVMYKYVSGQGSTYTPGAMSAPLEVVTAPSCDNNFAIKETAATSKSISISWPAVSGSTGYKVSQSEYSTSTSFGG